MLYLLIREEVFVMYGDKKVVRVGFLRRLKKNGMDIFYIEVYFN